MAGCSSVLLDRCLSGIGKSDISWSWGDRWGSDTTTNVDLDLDVWDFDLEESGRGESTSWSVGADDVVGTSSNVGRTSKTSSHLWLPFISLYCWQLPAELCYFYQGFYEMRWSGKWMKQLQFQCHIYFIFYQFHFIWLPVLFHFFHMTISFFPQDYFIPIPAQFHFYFIIPCLVSFLSSSFHSIPRLVSFLFHYYQPGFISI